MTLPWRALLAAALLAGCSNAGQDKILAVAAKGVVQGFVYFDANGSKTYNPSAGDSVLARIGIRLIAEGTSDTVARATTATTGVYRLPSTPVGNYVIVVDTTGFGDSLRIEKIDSAKFTVTPAETVTVNVAVSYPQVSIAAARALPPGRSVFVTGVAFNSLGTFSDTVVFLGDTSRAIRLTRLRTAVAAGDSVRVKGVTGSRAGQPTLDAGTTIPLGKGLFPPVPTLTTAAAATAAGGTHDAQLVSVKGATIGSTLQTSTNFVLTVDDSSGPLDVELDPASDAAFKPANLPGNYTVGNKFDMLGVLAPTGTGTWRLRPRSATDLTLIPLPVISIAAARALPAGRTVVVVGVALNNPSIFSDTTVHLADTSGAIRLTRLRSPITAGDSVKVKAVTGSRAGEPTLDAGTTTPLGLGLFPAAVTLTTAAAATAVGGTRDAQLIVVLNATVSDTATVVGAFKLTVSDGSGNLDVLLDQRIPFIVPGQYIPTNRFNIVGLLVPTGTGAWTLKPRSSADLTKQ
jgi:hypothetical protein